MSYLNVVNGITWKYEYKRIIDEMPIIKLKSKKWFLWRLTDGEWDYIGYYDTRGDVSTYILGQAQ